MATTRHAAVLAVLCSAACLPAQQLKPEALQDYSSYVQAAEARLAARPTFLVIDADPRQARELPHGAVLTVPGNGPNPHKVRGALLYDWIGTIFIPGVTVDRVVRMLQDYDHRAEYLPDLIVSARLSCRTGDNRFGFSMRIKEPIEADADYDVVWDRLDDQRWRYRSYSGDVHELKPKGYLYRLSSYWRISGNSQGAFIEAETISLSGEFGSMLRTLGSIAGMNPEKSVKRTLTSMRDAALSHREFAPPPQNLPACQP
jgi:hypothetical protein